MAESIRDLPPPASERDDATSEMFPPHPDEAEAKARADEEKAEAIANMIAGDKLKGFIDQLERAEEEKKAINDHVSEIYSAAKAEGFNKAVIKEVLKLRKKSEHDRQEHLELVDLYMHALGMTR